MNIKSIMLGTAAGFMAVSGAQAADLPGEPVPAAVDYVKVCDTFGAGFFYIPGTDTCLDISGRVRFSVEYTENGDGPNNDDVSFKTDARVDFDVMSSTEYGTLRAFTRVSSEDNRNAQITNAYIQLGYLIAGYTGDLGNGDVLYGNYGHAYDIFDNDRAQITLFADDLGGGFYAGASINARLNGLGVSVDDDGQLGGQARVGIKGQPWGGVDLSFGYNDFVIGSEWAVKATADLKLVENFDVRLVAAYRDPGANEVITLAGALKYTAGAFVPYAGIRYDITDIGPDVLGAAVGVDYTVVSGLVATGELDFTDTGPNETVKAIARLTRSW